jgi:uronate dehydrogenase
MTTVLFTGGTGRMGKVLRAGLAGEHDRIRLLVRTEPDVVHDREEVVYGDLLAGSTLVAACRGVDVVVHLAGTSDEAPFDTIVDQNIRGAYNVFEAARRTGVRRVVYASSNHITGCYSVSEPIDTSSPVRPDSLYGVSKAFGEALARMYHDKWGLEVVCLRIGSFRQEPEDSRQLSTWLSYRDGTELVRRSIIAPDLGFEIVYGVSANQRSWWDNDEAARRLGYLPMDDAERYVTDAAGSEERGRWQGGAFAHPTYRGGTWLS